MRFAAGLLLGTISLLGACASLPGQAPPQGYATALALWTANGDCDFTRPDRARLRSASTSHDYIPPARDGADSIYVVRGAEAHGRLLRGTYCLSVARGPEGGEPDATYGFTVTVGRRNTETVQVQPAFASVRRPDGVPLRVHVSLGAVPASGGDESIVAFDLGPIPGDGVPLEPEAPAQRLGWPKGEVQADTLRLVAVVQESTDLGAAGPVPPDRVRDALSAVGD